MTTTAPAAEPDVQPAVAPPGVPDDAASVLGFAREQRAAADLAERRLLEAAVQWAVIHPAETLDDAEGYASRVHLAGVDEQPVTLAGPGAPLIREFAVAEFAAAIGLSTEAGKRYVGHALELRYRLPRLGPVPATPPPQDPLRLDLHGPRTRHLPLVQPHGYQHLRDHEGTRDLTREEPPRRDDPHRD